MRTLKTSLIFLSFFLLGLNSNALVFEQNCHIVNDEDVLKMALIFTDPNLSDRVTWRTTAFEDENCKTPYIIFDRLFQFISNTPSEILLISLESSYTPISDEVAEALNMMNYCELNTWQAGQKQVVTGRTCQDYVQLREYQQITYSQSGFDPNAQVIKWDGDQEPYQRQ